MDGLISEDHDNQVCLVEDLLDSPSSLAEQMGLPHDTDTLSSGSIGLQHSNALKCMIHSVSGGNTP